MSKAREVNAWLMISTDVDTTSEVSMGTLHESVRRRTNAVLSSRRCIGRHDGCDWPTPLVSENVETDSGVEVADNGWVRAEVPAALMLDCSQAVPERAPYACGQGRRAAFPCS